ncbi:MAG: shikimate dehydrogenase [Gemmatimonadales bacterium]|nr:shikimate dehydrogenase [Gemmatimonadales bacterium]
MIKGSTRIFAVLGAPVAHSLSPVMHNAALRVLGINAVYVALPCADDAVASVIRALTAAGGGGSVTRPHKQRAAAAVIQPTELVRTLDACNTFWNANGAIAGDNTDVPGVLHAVGIVGGGRVWAVTGTGASARAVVEAAREAGVAVAIHSRSEARRASFVEWMRSRGVPRAALPEAEVLINATPLGWNDADPLPFEGETSERTRAAVDMVYRPGQTRWIQAMRDRGLLAADGREMLLGQGVAAFARWFPETMAPMEVMRAAVEQALHPPA